MDRPDRVGRPFLAHPSATRGYFDPAAFARQAIGTAGNAGRNTLHGPHQRRADVSVFRTFPLREAVALQIRAECFSLSNTANFAQPSGTITSYAAIPDANGRYLATGAGNFGVSTATAPGSAARQFQFAARVTF